MLTEHEQDSRHHRATQLDRASNDLAEHDGDSTDSPRGMLHSLQTLMSSVGLSAHRNVPVRANLIQGMQQMHGNVATVRAVQRYVGRSSQASNGLMPVQRSPFPKVPGPVKDAGEWVWEKTGGKRMFNSVKNLFGGDDEPTADDIVQAHIRKVQKLQIIFTNSEKIIKQYGQSFFETLRAMAEAGLPLPEQIESMGRGK